MLVMAVPALFATITAAAGIPVPADIADVRCVAIFSEMVGDGIPNVKLTEEQKSGIATLVMYYVGKLEGRGNGIDLAQAIVGEIAPEGALDRLVREDLPRCGKETEARGTMLSQLGKRLEAVGK